MYGEDIEFDVHKLTMERLEYAKNFKCGNKEIDKYLKEKALQDMECGNTVTKIIVNKQNNDIIGYYSICCTSIIMETYKHRYFSPAVEIKMFALDENYQGIIFSCEDEEDMFSDHIFCEIIKKIVEITELYVGARTIMLYSVPKAINFYKRNWFETFENYMLTDDNLYIKGCMPMYLEL
jgi:hypothetical protein